MRVALIHHQFKLKGGMETYLLNLINGFNNQDDQVAVYVYKETEVRNKPLCEIKKTNLFWLPRAYRKFWFASQLYKRKELKNYDLKISLMRSFHQDLMICGGTHKGFLKHTNKKMRFLDKLEIACEQKSYDTAQTIIAHSELVKEELIDLYGIDANKIVLAYPPIDTNKFNQTLQTQRTMLRKKFGLAENKKALLFPSTGHKRKGFFLIIEALRKLPINEFELVVAGNEPKEKLAKNIKYVGFIEDMHELYTACDVTLLPSLYEPFGLVVVESLQCGTPVIVSKFVGAKDFITENEGLILKNLTADDIANAIKEVSSKKFTITNYFAEQKELTLDQHVKKLKFAHVANLGMNAYEEEKSTRCFFS